SVDLVLLDSVRRDSVIAWADELLPAAPRARPDPAGAGKLAGRGLGRADQHAGIGGLVYRYGAAERRAGQGRRAGRAGVQLHCLLLLLQGKDEPYRARRHPADRFRYRPAAPRPRSMREFYTIL